MPSPTLTRRVRALHTRWHAWAGAWLCRSALQARACGVVARKRRAAPSFLAAPSGGGSAAPRRLRGWFSSRQTPAQTHHQACPTAVSRITRLDGCAAGGLQPSAWGAFTSTGCAWPWIRRSVPRAGNASNHGHQRHKIDAGFHHDERTAPLAELFREPSQGNRSLLIGDGCLRLGDACTSLGGGCTCFGDRCATFCDPRPCLCGACQSFRHRPTTRCARLHIRLR